MAPLTPPIHASQKKAGMPVLPGFRANEPIWWTIHSSVARPPLASGGNANAQ